MYVVISNTLDLSPMQFCRVRVHQVELIAYVFPNQECDLDFPLFD